MDLATASFWLFLSVVVGSLIWRKTILRRETLATIRVAIEKNVPLEDSLMQAMLFAVSGDRPRTRTVSGDFFLVLGVLFAAAGLCLGILATFVPEPEPFVVLAIFGEVIACGLLILWRYFRQRALTADMTSDPS